MSIFNSYSPKSYLSSNFLGHIESAFKNISESYMMSTDREIILDVYYHYILCKKIDSTEFDTLFNLMKATYFSDERKEIIKQKVEIAVKAFMAFDVKNINVKNIDLENIDIEKDPEIEKYLIESSKVSNVDIVHYLTKSPNFDPVFGKIAMESGVHRFMSLCAKPNKIQLIGTLTENEFFDLFESKWKSDPLPLIYQSPKGFTFQQVKSILIYKQEQYQEAEMQ